MRIDPQSPLVLACVCLRLKKHSMRVVLHVPPSEALADQFHVDVAIAEVDLAHVAAVAIQADHVDENLFSKHLRR